MKHTPEPWAVVINYNDKSTFAIDNPRNPRSAYIADDIKEEDAARIVACVNACTGATNEDLEAEPYSRLRAELAMLKAQRDQLLEALKRIAEMKPEGRTCRERCFKIAVMIAQTAVFGLSKQEHDPTIVQSPVDRLLQHATNGQKMMQDSVHFYNAVYLLLAGVKPIQVIESLCEAILAQNEQIKRMAERKPLDRFFVNPVSKVDSSIANVNSFEQLKAERKILFDALYSIACFNGSEAGMVQSACMAIEQMPDSERYLKQIERAHAERREDMLAKRRKSRKS